MENFKPCPSEVLEMKGACLAGGFKALAISSPTFRRYALGLMEYNKQIKAIEEVRDAMFNGLKESIGVSGFDVMKAYEIVEQEIRNKEEERDEP
jgi:hypothetical protein